MPHLFGADWEKIKTEIVTNSYRSDIHFLPKDEQDSGFAGLASHSLVLFRYPLTVPAEVVDLAQATPQESWPAACSSLAGIYPASESFRAAQPLKVLSLKSEFLADLLTRYCAVYSRVGSPDFSAHSLVRITKEVDL
ncbi:hypothetical protein [Brevundimonas sp. LjRoot202]|uniref:hypothetical protein n=1 Tax=Brevundimonas sp. LjRoot202 TaxID=3342281 RepID=UPI003ECF5FCF